MTAVDVEISELNANQEKILAGNQYYVDSIKEISAKIEEFEAATSGNVTDEVQKYRWVLLILEIYGFHRSTLWI